MQSDLNLVSCTVKPTVGMSGGVVGVTGYHSKCHYLKSNNVSYSR
jgi:hypothetical protein